MKVVEPLSLQITATWPPDAVTVVPEGTLTATGVLLLVVVPLPSWPVRLRPQAQAERRDPDDPAAWLRIGDSEIIVADSARSGDTQHGEDPRRFTHGGQHTRVVLALAVVTHEAAPLFGLIARC